MREPTENDVRGMMRALADEVPGSLPSPAAAVRRAKRRLARNVVATTLSVAVLAWGAIAVVSRVTDRNSIPPAGSSLNRGDGIWLLEPGQGEPSRIRGTGEGDSSPRWTPDGRIMFSRRSNLRFIMNPDGSSMQRFDDERGSPFWSIDGRWMGFVKDGAISVVNRDRSLRRLATKAEGVPSFTPGGEIVYMCYHANQDLCSVKVDGSAPPRVIAGSADEEAFPSVAQDGRIAIAVGRSGVGNFVRVLRSAGDPRVVAEFEPQSFAPVWSRNGEILFHKYPNLVAAHPARPGDLRRLTFDPTCRDVWPNVNGSTGSVVFTRSCDPSTQIFEMDADGNHVRRLTNFPGVNGGPAMSPDGKYIAFGSTKDGFAAIYRMSSDGAELRRLTNDPEGAIRPVWSPDGSSIAFQRIGLRSDSPTGIWLMNADGTGWRSLDSPHSPLGRSPCWRFGGKRLVFEAHGVIYETEVATGKETRINAGSWPACGTDNVRFFIAGGDSIWRLSKDARGGSSSTTAARGLKRPPMALWWNGDNERDVLWSDGHDIYALDPNLGGSMRRITSGPAHDYNPSWTPDGRILFNSDR